MIEKFGRDKQTMILGMDYFNCSTMLKCAQDEMTLDIVTGVLGPNVEAFGKGQVFLKEPIGGTAKLMH